MISKIFSKPFLEELNLLPLVSSLGGSNGYVIQLSTPKSQLDKNRDRNLSDCESEAAFAGAGDKRQVFDNCMKR